MRTTMSSVATVVHDAGGLRCTSTSTRHCRRGADEDSSSGWSQIAGSSSHQFGSANHQRALGDAVSTPSMVSVTISVAYPDVGVGRLGPHVHSVRDEHESRGSDGPTASFDVGQVLVAEINDRRHHRTRGTVAQRAERLSQMEWK